MTQPKTYSFTLFLGGADVLSDDSLEALFGAGCDDAAFGERDGAQYAAFDRAAGSFTHALASAVADVTSAVPGLEVVRVSPEELVTLAAIAERAGLSREYVRLLAKHERGPGGFPAPVAYADHRTRLWYWPDAARWLQENKKSKATLNTEGAELVAVLNAALSYREHVRHLDKGELALVAEVVGDGPCVPPDRLDLAVAP